MNKILLIALSYFPPQTGGISTLMSEVLGRLESDSVVLTRVESMQAEEHKGVIRVNAKVGSRLQWLALISIALLTVIRHKPNLIVCATIEDAILASVLKRFFKLPYVVWTHGNEIVQLCNTARPWERAINSLKNAAKVISVSHFTAGHLEQLGVLSKQLVVIHPGCNVDSFARNEKSKRHPLRLKEIESTDKILLTVGNLVRRKGHDKVIEALPNIVERHPDARYIIVGEGRDRDYLLSVAKKHNMEKHVIFFGKATQEVLIQMYSVAKVFVMPSRYIEKESDVEGFGIVYLEANCCGLPVIGGRAGGVPDAIQDGKSGFLVDPLNVNAISEKIIFLLDHPKKAKAMGEWGRQRVIDYFSWEQIGSQVQEEINKILEYDACN